MVVIVAVAVVTVTVRTVLFHPFDLTIYPMCSRHRCQETLLHYMHSCIVTLEKVHAHSPPDSNNNSNGSKNNSDNICMRVIGAEDASVFDLFA